MPDTSDGAPVLEDRSQQRLLIILISLASFMGALDSTIVNISLPSIAAYFNTSIPVVSWVAMAYLLMLASTLIAFGRLADIRGYRNVYLWGFTIFTAGSFFCGMFAFSIVHLVGFRILQAIGAAMLQAIGGAMIMMYLPAAGRGKALGIMTTFASVGVAAGPVLGGFISQFLSWHWIFLINIPVGIVAIVLGLSAIPRDRTPTPGSHPHFDAAGAGILFGALGTLIFAINMGRTLGWTSPLIVGSLVGTIVFFAIFIFWERRCKVPLIDLSMFKDRNFTFANAGALIAMLLVSGSSFLLPFYLELSKGLATGTSGLILMIPAIALMVMGPVAGRLSDTIGSRRLCIGASVCYIAAYLLYSQMTSTTSYLHLIVALILMGTAAGLFIPPNMSLILSLAPRGCAGVVSSLSMTMRNIGSVFAVALYGAIFIMAAESTAASQSVTSITPSVLDAGFHSVFLFGAVLGIVIFALSFLVKERKLSREPDKPGEVCIPGGL